MTVSLREVEGPEWREVSVCQRNNIDKGLSQREQSSR